MVKRESENSGRARAVQGSEGAGQCRPSRPASRSSSAARRHFASKGYAATSLKEIAADAGVSVQTVYDSVGSKPSSCGGSTTSSMSKPAWARSR